MKTYLFVDMEFSGLDYSINKPLEIAVIAADAKFKTIKTYSSVFYWNSVEFNDWSEAWHSASGLLDEIPEGKEAEDIDTDLVKFVGDVPGDLILAGQSVHVDREWIIKYLPRFYLKLNHRVFDLSTIDMLLEGLGSSIRNRSSEHRALPDARAALNSARHYAKNISYSATLEGNVIGTGNGF